MGLTSWLTIAGACAALGLAAMAGPAAADCPPGAPLGLFQGATGGGASERIDVTLNLTCADGRYVAQFFTSRSDFTAREATGGEGYVALKFDRPQLVGAERLVLSGDTLKAALGPLSFTRVGPALPLDGMQPTLALTKAQWRQDLAAFAAELPRRHANAFAFLPKPRFDAEIASLDRRIATLNDDEIFVTIERLTNAIGDGHTYVSLPPDRRSLPIEIARFGTGPAAELRVVAAGAGYEQALGARVVAIGPTPVGEAWRRALTLTPQQELPALQEGRAVGYLRIGLLLHGLGIVPDRNHALFTLKTDAGRVFTLDLAGLSPAATPPPLIPASSAKGLAQTDPGKPFWCRALADQGAVYCAFHAYDDLGRAARDMFGLIKQAQPGKLIIDMRDNGGGDNTVGYAALVKPLKADAEINRKGHLYVLVSALTFSAAMNNAAQFQDETNAILVGQQIGETPNSYQEPRQFRLPNSHLIVRASSLYYKFRAHGPNAVTPDKTIVPTWADAKAGRDPVLDWVLAQPAA